MFFQIQTNIVITLILSIILVHAIFRLDRSEPMNKLFMSLVGLNIFIMLLEIGDVFANAGDFDMLYLIINLVGFITVPIFLILTVMYFEYWLQKTLKLTKKHNENIYIPAILLLILTVINIKTGWIATVNDEYIRGPLFWIIPAVSLFYLAYASLRVWRYHKRFIRYKYVLINMYVVILTITILIQIIGEIYLTIWNTVGGLLVCTYIFNIIDELQYDALTTMENKQSYLSYVSKLSKRKQVTLTAINIDLDDFKLINDQYGHQEGDEALKIFTQMLRASFPYKQRIFRMGGDEFLVLSEQQSKKQMLKYLERFKERLSMYNATRGKPYTLKFSYGIDSYNEDYSDVEEFLEYIDSMMYMQKQKKKRGRI